MDSYAANGIITAVTGAPGDTALALLASATRRARVHLIIFSVIGAPVADNILQWLVRRLSVDGTGTAVVPSPLDLGAPASGLTAKQTYTAEPTYTTSIFDLGIHMRAPHQWNAAPGKGIIVPAVAGAGLGCTPIHASYVGSAQATMHWTE